MVVSCPCAFVISVPLSCLYGIGAASKMGILIKGGNYLEALAKTDIVVFDKTGTLTEGKFKVSDIHTIDVLKRSSSGWRRRQSPCPTTPSSIHPGDIPVRVLHLRCEVDAGDSSKEVKAVIRGRRIHVGNHRLMDEIGVEYCAKEVVGTNIHVVVNGKYLGHIIVFDTVKSNTAETISMLKTTCVRKTVMLFGDLAKIYTDVGMRLGIDDIVNSYS